MHQVIHAAVLTCCMTPLHVQTSFEDKETGQVLSAVDCYFQCQVRTQPAAEVLTCGLYTSANEQYHVCA